MEITEKKINPWVIVVAVACGYFVDLYDLLLFGSIRVSSLKELGITGETSANYASLLMNITVAGMLIGGFTWGIIADKKGRLTVLFASIITYTIANFINAFVTNITTYEICRFIAGFGLAGELGVGVTLISEILPKEKRTLATMIISGFGMLGAATSGFLTYNLKDVELFGISSWRFLFIVGGILGLGLLFFRMSTSAAESSLFKQVQNKKTQGNLFILLSDKQWRKKFLYCFLVGAPIFFIIGNFVTLAPEYGKLSGINTIQASLSVLFCYLSITVFDFLGTVLSKCFKTRKKIILSFLIIQTVSIIVFLFFPTQNETVFYLKIAFLGMGIGSWGIIVVNSAEQFGTNIRATVTTSVPNLIRGLLLIQTYAMVNPLKPYLGFTNSAVIVSAASLIVAFISIWKLEDNFEREINYEEIKSNEE